MRIVLVVFITLLMVVLSGCSTSDKSTKAQQVEDDWDSIEEFESEQDYPPPKVIAEPKPKKKIVKKVEKKKSVKKIKKKTK